MLTTRRRLSRLQRVRIFDGARGICHVCKLRIDGTRQPWEVEHVIALADGGADEPHNMAPVHKHPCHQDKTADESTLRAKAVRIRAKHIGAQGSGKMGTPRSRLPFGKNFPLRKTIANGVIARPMRYEAHARLMAQRYATERRT